MKVIITLINLIKMELLLPVEVFALGLDRVRSGLQLQSRPTVEYGFWRDDLLTLTWVSTNEVWYLFLRSPPELF